MANKWLTTPHSSGKTPIRGKRKAAGTELCPVRYESWPFAQGWGRIARAGQDGADRMGKDTAPGGRWLLALMAGWALVLGGLWLAVPPAHPEITVFYRLLQDQWLLRAMLGIWAGAMLVLWRGPRVGPFRMGPRAVWVAIAIGCIVTLAGHYLVLCAYDLSRDEQMVSFDAAIYRAGRLAWPVPVEWRGDIAALNTLFMMPLAHPAAWVSTYLPGNAVMEALLGPLKGPVLLAISVLALRRVAQRLLGPDQDAQWVTLALFLLSGQVIFSAMSRFAMPPHLALNLVWLWLFLIDRRRTDVAALAVGFVATGLHQPLFHPMFVAPWLALLLWQRRWGRLALFAGAYLVVGLFWLWWPHLTLSAVTGPDSVVVDAGSDYVSRLFSTLAQNRDNGTLMAANLLRMVLWTHPAMWVLTAFGAIAGWRDGRVLALLGGIVVVVVVMGLILPYQGHGFGYRYLHPMLGNAALLGGMGWQRLGESWRDRLRGGMVALSALTLLVLMPMQGWMAHQLYGAFADASAKIDSVHADYIIIGNYDAPLALDLGYNRPDLSNRPLRLIEYGYDDLEDMAPRLCAHGETLALPRRSFYFGIGRALHMMPGRTTERRLAWHTQEFVRAGCKVISLF